MALDRDVHRTQLAEHFSNLHSYWRDIYSAPVEKQDFFHHTAVKKRKHAVLDMVAKYSIGDHRQILDAGCGTGIIMKELFRRGHKVCGVDVSAVMLKEAAAMLSEFSPEEGVLRLGTVDKLDFPDHFFDFSLCIGVLQYLQDDGVAIKELARVTKPNGYIIISLPNIARMTVLFDPYYYLYRGPLFILYKIFGFRRRSDISVSEDIHRNLTFRNRRYYYGQLHGLCRLHGLTVCEVNAIGYGPLTFWKREFLSRDFTLRIAGQIERLARLTMFSFLRAFADRWVLVLQKG